MSEFEKAFLFISITILSVFYVLCTGSCVSTGRVDPAILEYQRQIDELESRVRSYEATTEYTIRELETVSGRASKMGTTIDELIELFDEYQRTVERILYNYRATESKVEYKTESSTSISDCPRS